MDPYTNTVGAKPQAQRPKYTKQQLDLIVSEYLQGATAQQLSQTHNFSERSIIAKLSSLGVYKKKQYRNKRGEPSVKKIDQIKQLAQLLDTSEDRLECLEKCTKWVLDLIIHKLDPKP